MSSNSLKLATHDASTHLLSSQEPTYNTLYQLPLNTPLNTTLRPRSNRPDAGKWLPIQTIGANKRLKGAAARRQMLQSAPCPAAKFPPPAASSSAAHRADTMLSRPQHEAFTSARHRPGGSQPQGLGPHPSQRRQHVGHFIRDRQLHDAGVGSCPAEPDLPAVGDVERAAHRAGARH